MTSYKKTRHRFFGWENETPVYPIIVFRPQDGVRLLTNNVWAG